MLKKGALVVIIFASLFIATGPVRAGQEGKVTGSLKVFKNGSWLHRFSFSAQEMGDEQYDGKGFLFHQRIGEDGKVSRVEQCMILYVIVDGNEAWFAGPVFYDSTDPNPTHWFVVYVEDGSQPRGDNDLIWFTRADNENDAHDLLECEPNSCGTYPPDPLESGNLRVH